MLLMWHSHMTNWQWKKGEVRFDWIIGSLHFSINIFEVSCFVCFVVDFGLFMFGDLLKPARL